MDHITLTVCQVLFLCLLSAPPLLKAASVESLVACLTDNGIANFTTAQTPAFDSILDFSLQNLRFTEPGVLKPATIILPSAVSEVPHAWACVRAANFALRVRNGGHSYEGLSSTATAPFVIIDLMNLNAISVNVAKKSAWVEAGARLGELYHAVATASSSTLGFSAGTCSTIGLSGHIMGGGFGFLSRKYGVAADNVLEAQVITANGTLIKKLSTVDPELFWAVRGGGGGAWGIVVAWKLKLVSVPAVITTFNVWRTGKKAITDLVYKWQSVAPAVPAPPELAISIFMFATNVSGVADMNANFTGQYWGTINQTVALLGSLFPELGLNPAECAQGSWIQAVTIAAGLPATDALLNRQSSFKYYFKAKSDYVSKPLTKEELSGAYDTMMKNTNGIMIFEPYGGIMSQIKSDAIAFPHRAGNLFMIQYLVVWVDETNAPDNALIAWIRGLYIYMAPFVTYTPSRSTYVNYIDLDLGDSVSAGKSYFGSNLAKLVKIKARVDPSNLFSQPQSVPTSL